MLKNQITVVHYASCFVLFCNLKSVKVKVSHSLIARGAVGVRVSLYLGHR